MKKFFAFFAAMLFVGSMMAADLLNIDFTQGQGSWTINDVEKDTLNYVWQQTANYGMKASAYTTASHVTESWLISPAIDMSGVTSATMAISHAMNKGDNSTLAVFAKSGDGEAWQEVELSAWPAGTNWTFIDATADLSAYAGKAAVQIAFMYVSTQENCPTWEVKTVVISEGEAPVVVPADVIFLPADFEGQGVSSTGGDITATKEGVTISSNKGFGHSAALRIYKNGSFSVVSSEQQIGKIVFTFGSYQGTPKDGGLDTEIVVNGMEYRIESMAAAAYMEKIEIFFGEAEGPVDPVYPPLPDGVLTCEAAAELAASAADPTAENKNVEVQQIRVRGFVTFAYNASEGKQSAWIADDKKATAGIIQGYYLEALEEVVKGDYVELEGMLVKYFKAGKDGKADEIILELTNGTMTKIYPEDIENVVLTKKAQKVMINGALYIIRDNKMYNVQGALVR